ncbi:pathogenesis-related protein STH-2-like [Eucalyptus grandis]|uniref:pathogenesis-related protein STH-2-like n=1 Tax=Eucalyptus grandis TaxID=71139 RepID=UPI00192E9865|nr:pathogenesis-related protein STH-2-like [Eucalyptus grandis]
MVADESIFGVLLENNEIISYTHEFATPIAPSGIFKALVLNSYNLMPNIVPQGIKNNEFIRGDGSIGRIKLTNFAKVDNSGSHLKYLKHKIDAIDPKNHVCKYTLIEADTVFDKIKSVAYEVKFEASSDDGCVYKMTNEYHYKARSRKTSLIWNGPNPRECPVLLIEEAMKAIKSRSLRNPQLKGSLLILQLRDSLMAIAKPCLALAS